jgi:mannosyl-oligosaccharide alpha-1,2-mannosidase
MLAQNLVTNLLQQFMMLGGQLKQYQTMYEKFVEVAKKHLFFRPMTVGDEDILISGTLQVNEGSESILTPELQHLTCFTGGMLAIAGKIFNRPDDFKDGARLTDGCVWAYKNTVTGIMPETLVAVPCKSKMNCHWDTKVWWDSVDADASEDGIREIVTKQKLSPGFSRIQDGRYLLR